MLTSIFLCSLLSVPEIMNPELALCHQEESYKGEKEALFTTG